MATLNPITSKNIKGLTGEILMSMFTCYVTKNHSKNGSRLFVLFDHFHKTYSICESASSCMRPENFDTLFTMPTRKLVMKQVTRYSEFGYSEVNETYFMTVYNAFYRLCRYSDDYPEQITNTILVSPYETPLSCEIKRDGTSHEIFDNLEVYLTQFK